MCLVHIVPFYVGVRVAVRDVCVCVCGTRSVALTGQIDHFSTIAFILIEMAQSSNKVIFGRAG